VDLEPSWLTRDPRAVTSIINSPRYNLVTIMIITNPSQNPVPMQKKNKKEKEKEKEKEGRG